MEAADRDGAVTTPASKPWEIVLETLIGNVQKLTVVALAGMLVVVVLLSTVHLGVMIGEEVAETATGAHSSPGPARNLRLLLAGTDRGRTAGDSKSIS